MTRGHSAAGWGRRVRRRGRRRRPCPSRAPHPPASIVSLVVGGSWSLRPMMRNQPAATPSVMQCPQGSLSAVSFQGIAGCRLPVWGDPAVSGVGGIGDMRRGRNVQSALPCSAEALQKLTHASSDIVFRLPEELLNVSTTRPPRRGRRQRRWSLTILDEGLKTRRFPGIVYRDGPTGRRAAVVGGPDVWEIIRVLKQMPGKDERRVPALADELELSPPHIRLAIDFYGTDPSEVDDRIPADDLAAEQLRKRIDCRERLLFFVRWLLDEMLP